MVLCGDNKTHGNFELKLHEVDLLLHPLKSELNFPCGPKDLLQPAPQPAEA